MCFLTTWPGCLETRQSVIVLRNEGHSMRDIAKKLKISLKGVHYCLERKAKCGSNKDRKRSGRPRSTSSSEDKYVRVSSLRNRRLTCPELTANLNSARDVLVSCTTVRRRLQQAGLHGRIQEKETVVGKEAQKLDSR